jgi:hypothetical protein
VYVGRLVAMTVRWRAGKLPRGHMRAGLFKEVAAATSEMVNGDFVG